jgi:FMN phosphatase YigB (HAD superfamily)
MAAMTIIDNMHLKRILFCDYNGVLSYNKFWSTISDPEHVYHSFHNKIIKYLFVENAHIIDDWMTGKYTLEEIHTMISEYSGIPYEFILATFIEECKKMDASEALLRIIANKKDSYYRILATGNMDSFNRFTLPANPLLRSSFDEINNSYDVGILKNTDNGRYFVEKSKQLGVPLENSVLIDDSQQFCDIFTRLGGTAFCVTGVENVKKVLNYLT